VRPDLSFSEIRPSLAEGERALTGRDRTVIGVGRSGPRGRPANWSACQVPLHVGARRQCALQARLAGNRVAAAWDGAAPLATRPPSTERIHTVAEMMLW